ncbi:tetratricopeptide repeat protein [Psychrobacter aquimaris]|uniref:tetratricopeptide repeat protein n=1 Tax=Psychrobacter aquimaris TaxID=292733 RepID=UPI003FD1A5AB
MNINNLKDLDDETRKKIKELKKITHKNKEGFTFADAQFDIGIILMDKGFLDIAINEFSKISKYDSLELYFLSKEYIGDILKKQNKTGKAIEVWKSIEKPSAPTVYLRANFKIGEASIAMGNIEESISAWKVIDEKDHPILYPTVQLLIGKLLIQKGKTKEAIEALAKINVERNPERYAEAQLTIGKQLIKVITRQPKKNINEAKIAFSNAARYFPYETYCYIQICEFLLDESTYMFGRKLQIFFNKIVLIIRELTLDFDDLNNNQKLPERKLAHYTSVDTTNKLLSIDIKEKLPSSFRLNTINNVNDPSEGKLLSNYLNEIKEDSFAVSDFNENFHAFVSCFTFNHDSLNQFRLYGKKDNQEASGVSLVLNKDFFQSTNTLNVMSFVSSLTHIQSLNDVVVEKEKILIDRVNDDSSKKINRKPVMRCIYIEPESDYVYLAQRNCLTFYREFSVEERPEKEWSNYKEGIDNKTVKVKLLLAKLKMIYKSLKIKHSKYFEQHFDVINKNILPLKYLIKHSAFQEEQECRMVYITSLNRPEVQMDFGKFLYVEYEPEVKAHLDKIYIAPAATQYQPYLAKLLCDTNVKIDLSNNPYRQT